MNKIQAAIKRLCRIPDADPQLGGSPVNWTLKDWRNNEKLVEGSQKLRQNRIYTAQLEVLRNMHPGRSVTALGVPANDLIKLKGMAEGFQLCLNMLDAFALPRTIKEAVEATFEPESS